MDFQYHPDGRKELKAIFNIDSQNNPLMIYPNQSLLQELQADSNMRTYIVIQDFHTAFSTAAQAQFTHNSKKNQEIGILVEGVQGFFNNNKLQTNLVASVFPDFQNQTTQDLHYRLSGVQLNGVPMVQKPYIKISFVIRDITNTQEDNNFSYRLVNFENVYTILFALY